MRAHTIRFRPIKARCDYFVCCSACGKTLRRVASAEHTVNPFNKNADGSVRTPAEVYECAKIEAKARAEKLAATPTKCRACAALDDREG